MDRLAQARATFDRRSLAWDRMKDRLPSHQRAEVLSDLMEACEALDEFLPEPASDGAASPATSDVQPSAVRAA